MLLDTLLYIYYLIILERLHRIFNFSVNFYLKWKPLDTITIVSTTLRLLNPIVCPFSRSVKLNGQVLRMVDDRTLPLLKGRELPPGEHLKLPGFSFAFYVLIEAQAPVCKWALIKTAFTGQSGTQMRDDKIFSCDYFMWGNLMKWIIVLIYYHCFVMKIHIYYKYQKDLV